MALSKTNVPNWLDIVPEIDVSGDNDFVVSTNFKPDLAQMSESGGGYNTGSVGTADGTTHVGVGAKQPVTKTFRCVYSDGETADLWETLKDAEGQDAAVRYQPKGAGSGNRRHIITGVLRRVSLPTPDGDGPYIYEFEVFGNDSYEAEV